MDNSFSKRTIEFVLNKDDTNFTMKYEKRTFI